MFSQGSRVTPGPSYSSGGHAKPWPCHDTLGPVIPGCLVGEEGVAISVEESCCRVTGLPWAGLRAQGAAPGCLYPYTFFADDDLPTLTSTVFQPHSFVTQHCISYITTTKLKSNIIVTEFYVVTNAAAGFGRRNCPLGTSRLATFPDKGSARPTRSYQHSVKPSQI